MPSYLDEEYNGDFGFNVRGVIRDQIGNYIDPKSYLPSTKRVDAVLGNYKYLVDLVELANPESYAAIQLTKYGAEAYLALTEVSVVQE